MASWQSAEALAHSGWPAAYARIKNSREPSCSRLFCWRRHPDLNWGIRVLQTHALPLGYGAVLEMQENNVI